MSYFYLYIRNKSYWRVYHSKKELSQAFSQFYYCIGHSTDCLTEPISPHGSSGTVVEST